MRTQGLRSWQGIDGIPLNDMGLGKNGKCDILWQISHSLPQQTKPMSALLQQVLLYVKNNQPCSLPRNPDLLPEEFKTVDRSKLDQCVSKALADELLEGTHLSNGFSYLRLTPKGESAANP